jgi:hypothetical protein
MRAARRHFGWYVLGASLAVPVGVALLVVGETLKRQQMALETELSNPRRETLTAPMAYWKGVNEGLSEFYAYLPVPTTVPEVVSGLMSLGRAGGLVLQSGEYQAQPEPTGEYLRYTIVLPISGDANDIQSFVLHALWKYPTISLESVTFKRQRIDSRRVESRLRLALLTSLEGDGEWLTGGTRQ